MTISNQHQNGTTSMDSFNSIKDCPFCMEKNGNSYGVYGEDTKKIFESRIVTYPELSEIMIFPDLSPITTGHVLICSKAHINNFSSIDNKLTYEHIEIAIKSIFNAMSIENDLIFFEHGSSSCISENGCVQHAHLHVVPIGKNYFQSVIESVKKHGLLQENSFNSIECEYNWLNQNINGNHYILIGSYNHENGLSVMSALARIFPSQLIRYILSETLGISAHIIDEKERERVFIKTMSNLKNVSF